MLINEIDLETIQISDPSSQTNNDDIYEFGIHCVDQSPLQFSLTSPLMFRIECPDGNASMKHHALLKSKEDLISVDKLTKHIVSLFYKHHDKWFENSFTESELENLFVNILTPNLHENCIQLQCVLSADIHRTLFDMTDSSGHLDVEILPIMQMKHIVFDGRKFKIIVEMTSFNTIQNANDFNSECTTQLPPPPTLVQHDVDESDNRVELEEDNSLRNDDINLEHDNDEKVSANTEPNDTSQNDENDNHTILESHEGDMNASDAEEVFINMDELDDSNIRVNEEDFYVLHNLIQDTIKGKMRSEFISMFQKKGLELDDTEISNLIYDSSDEDDDEEDDHSMSNDSNDDQGDLSEVHEQFNEIPNTLR